MSKHIVDSELLDQAVAAIEKEMCVQCDGISCCRPESLTTLGRLRAILAQPSADCGLEVVAYLDITDNAYSASLLKIVNVDTSGAAELVLKSDADARDAMRLERIKELEAQLVGYDKLIRDANRYRWFRWNASESFYGNEVINLVNDPVSLDRAIDTRLNGGNPNE